MDQLTQKILSKMKDGVVACDAEGKLCFINDTLRIWHGLPEESIPPEDWAQHYNLFHGDGKTPMSAEDIPLRRAFLGESVMRTQMAIKVPGREIRYCEASGEALYDEAGVRTGAFVVMHDITTLVRARNIFQDALESSLSGFDIVSEKGEFVYANKAYLKMWGYESLDEMIGTSPASHCADPDVHGKIISALKATGSCLIEFKARRKDGTTFDVLMSARLDHDEKGLEIYPSFSVDLSPIRKAQENLRDQAELTKTVTDNAASSLFIMDINGHPTFMNPAAMELTGYDSLDDIREKPLHYAVHWKKPDGSYYPMEECPIDNAQAVLKKVQNAEEIFCRKDGTLFPVSYSIMPLTKNGHVVGSVLEFRDISLEKKIRRDLEDAVRVRDEFLSIASHELKTPLTSLFMQNQFQKRLVEKGDPKAYAPERIEKIVQQSERLFGRLNRLIDDMLDVSRIQSGKLMIRREKVDLKEVLEGLTKSLAPEVQEEDRELVLRAPIRVETFLDPVRIEQVASNLISNALRYGKGSIHITLSQIAEMVRVEVSDEGPGISEEDKRIIFNRFERAINANEVSGLGLGLYISLQIVEAHGGRIWVESTEGQGSTFIFELPVSGNL